MCQDKAHVLNALRAIACDHILFSCLKQRPLRVPCDRPEIGI